MEKVEVAGIKGLRILNSRAEWTNEFVVHLADGSRGRGSAPRGETISVYEGRPKTFDPGVIVQRIASGGILRHPVTQADFDGYLAANLADFGRNNCYALSVAFFQAVSSRAAAAERIPDEMKEPFLPKICLNVLNGGRYAYTNPVRSDFSEYLLVPGFQDLHRSLKDHARIQERVKSGLETRETTTVNGNTVHEMGGNRGCIRFLEEVLEDLELRDSYRIMIDASAGDMKADGGYRLDIADEGFYDSPSFVEMWKSYIREYDVGYLEDPFAEDDISGWKSLTSERNGCHVVGDNLYSSNFERIEKGSREGWATGVIMKPDQAGSVTATKEAVSVARAFHQVIISSHRSISTESMFLVDLSVEWKIPYIKIGPLMTDFSSLMRINEFLRRAG